MFGRNKKENIVLYEGEELLGTFKLLPAQLLSSMGVTDTFGAVMGKYTGKFHVTNQRIICDLPQFNESHTVFHNDILSFNWGKNIPTEGTRFTMLYRYKNNFNKLVHLHVELRVHDRKQIIKLLEDKPYYGKPLVIPNDETPESIQPVINNDDPLTILKSRYAKGEISKEEFDEMKKDLE